MTLTSIPPSLRRKLRIWLGICLSMVGLMVLVGGLTRLTESGLSMVEWKPLHILPPLNAAQWQEEFAKYQQFPEYQRVNRGMALGEFQHIFWLEYVHRLLGRAVGLVFFLPLLGFALMRRVPRRLLLQLLGIFALGGLQGVIGWVMVRSGLQDHPWVSPVKLALHLGTAFILFALILWQFLRLKTPHAPAPQHSPILVAQTVRPKRFPRLHFFAGVPSVEWARLWVFSSLALLLLQILLGALVAGRDAGMIFNTYPTMNGDWLPPDLLALHPLWRNIVENITTIQFDHRLMAHWLVLQILATFTFLYGRLPRIRHFWSFRLLLPVLALQFTLGVSTLLWQVPIPLASAHQMGALCLWAVMVTLYFDVQQLRNTRNSLLSLVKNGDKTA